MKRCSELHNLRKNASDRAFGLGYVAADYEQLASLGSASGYISISILALYMNSAEVAELYARPEIWGCSPDRARLGEPGLAARSPRADERRPDRLRPARSR